MKNLVILLTFFVLLFACKNDDDSGVTPDAIRLALSASSASYDAASPGTWVQITGSEYNNIANSVNAISKSGTTDTEYASPLGSTFGSAGFSRANVFASRNIPGRSYLVAFKYKTFDNETHIGNQVKLSEISNTDGFANVGGGLPPHEGNGGDVFFALKAPNTATTNGGYLGFYHTERMSIFDVLSNGYVFGSGDTETLSGGPIDNFRNFYQGLSTTEKQWP